jgi:hypothetical protein
MPTNFFAKKTAPLFEKRGGLSVTIFILGVFPVLVLACKPV